MPTNDTLALAKLKTAVEVLDKRTAGLPRLQDRLERGEKQRKMFWAALFLAFVCGALLCVVVTWLVLGRSTSRSYYNHQLHNLACVQIADNPPGSQLVKDLRRDYPECPAMRRTPPPASSSK